MNANLRREIDSHFPFDEIKNPPKPDMSTFVIHNIVFTSAYSNATGEIPLPNPWYLTGGPLGNILRKSDKDMHFHMKVHVNDMNIALIIHPEQCIICGVKSYLVLLIVCNLITKVLRRRGAQMSSFHFASFITAMENTVCRVTLKTPYNFDNLQSLIRPQFTVQKLENDKDNPQMLFGAVRRRGRAGKRNNLKISHNELSFVLPASSLQRRPVCVVMKFYSDKESIICINGIHNLVLVYEILKETVCFLMHHHAELQHKLSTGSISVEDELYKRNLSRMLIRNQNNANKKAKR